MSDMIIKHSQDLLATQALIDNATASTRAQRSVVARNVLFGAAAVTGAAGLGIAASIWAWGQGTDPDALKEALAKMPPLTVVTKLDPDHNTVKLADGGEVSLKPGGEVSLKPGGEVKLDPNATVKVTGDLLAKLPDIEKQIQEFQKQPKLKNENGDVIKREVTVFTIVSYRDGEIHTGWVYADGGSKTPQTQFCYFTRNNPDGSSQRIELGINGVKGDKSHLMANFNDAFNHCTWYGGKA